MGPANCDTIQSLFDSVLKGYQGGLGVGQAVQMHGIAGVPTEESDVVFKAHPLFGDISELMVQELMTQRTLTRERVLQILKETS